MCQAAFLSCKGLSYRGLAKVSIRKWIESAQQRLVSHTSLSILYESHSH